MARILIIDDEHNIRMLMRLALQFVHHEVEMASDGQEGLKKYGDGADFDLVLLDQRMPGMEGLEVLKQIRYQNPAAKVIMATAFGTIDLAVEAMKAGATDFLRKPFTADTLRGAVKSVLSGPANSVSGDDAPLDGLTFGFTTINGFRIESQANAMTGSAPERQWTFWVLSPSDKAAACVVQLPEYIIELVKAQTDREEMPGGSRFWQAFCEEALANYLYQNAEFPPSGTLRVEDFSTGMKRWVESVLAPG